MRFHCNSCYLFDTLLLLPFTLTSPPERNPARFSIWQMKCIMGVFDSLPLCVVLAVFLYFFFLKKRAPKGNRRKRFHSGVPVTFVSLCPSCLPPSLPLMSLFLITEVNTSPACFREQHLNIHHLLEGVPKCCTGREQ